MRERAQALLDRAGRGDAGRQGHHRDVPLRSASRFCAARRRPLGLQARLLDPRSGRPREHRRGAGRHRRPRSRARRAVEDQRVEERARVAGGRRCRAARDDEELAAARAYANYDETLAAYQAVDFDDLIVRPLRLSRDAMRRPRSAGSAGSRTCWSTNTRTPIPRSTGCCARWSAKARHSPRWATTTRRSTAGAARRSTTWRSCRATIPQLKVIKLEQNYRSTVRILRSANALIANNPKLFDKRLWSELGNGDTIRVTACRRRRVRSRDGRAPDLGASSSSAAASYSPTSRSSIAATTRRACSRRRCARRASPTRSRAASRCSSARRSRTSSRTCVSSRTTTTIPRSCARSPRPSAAWARRRCCVWASIGDAPAGESLFAAAFAPELADAHSGAAARNGSSEFCTLVNDLRQRAEREPARRLLEELLARYRLRGLARGHARQARGGGPLQERARLHRLALAQGRGGRQRICSSSRRLVALITMLESRDGEASRCGAAVDVARGEGPRVSARLHRRSRGRHPAAPRGDRRRQRRGGAAAHVRRRHPRAADAAPVVVPRAASAPASMSTCQPSRFIGELAQEDLRYADTPLPPDEAAQEKAAGSARLASLKAALSR